jgi:hypothetical protein
MFKSSKSNPAKKRAREAAAARDKRLNQMKKVSSSSREKTNTTLPFFRG